MPIIADLQVPGGTGGTGALGPTGPTGPPELTEVTDGASGGVDVTGVDELQIEFAPFVQGGIRVIKCPFAYNTPNLLTGATVYTPTVGDILLDAWFEIDTAWDGTTPLGDLGTFVNANAGLFYITNVPNEMTIPDKALEGDGYLYGGFMSATAISDLRTNNNAVGGWERVVPGKFTAANPIKVVVSQDGTNTGADPGSTQGAAILYLVVATPVTA